jgi:hypothetical protein
MDWKGEIKAWDMLASMSPEDVSLRADVRYNRGSRAYEFICLGKDISVNTGNRSFSLGAERDSVLFNRLGGYSRLSILNYLVHAQNTPLSEKLVRPSDLPGGDIFSRGTHVLPLEKIADRFGNNLEAFLSIGRKIGGTQLGYGDMSLSISPFPRVPAVLIVWSGDEEFSSRASLLFDASCSSHLSADILWATAMMCVEIMLINEDAV